jgi:hypothetical protein
LGWRGGWLWPCRRRLPANASVGISVHYYYLWGIDYEQLRHILPQGSGCKLLAGCHVSVVSCQRGCNELRTPANARVLQISHRMSRYPGLPLKTSSVFSNEVRTDHLDAWCCDTLKPFTLTRPAWRDVRPRHHRFLNYIAL